MPAELSAGGAARRSTFHGELPGLPRAERLGHEAGTAADPRHLSAGSPFGRCILSGGGDGRAAASLALRGYAGSAAGDARGGRVDHPVRAGAAGGERDCAQVLLGVAGVNSPQRHRGHRGYPSPQTPSTKALERARSSTLVGEVSLRWILDWHCSSGPHEMRSTISRKWQGLSARMRLVIIFAVFHFLVLSCWMRKFLEYHGQEFRAVNLL